LNFIASEAHKENVPVSICGELASEPGGALLLMAMGYDMLSMNATNLPKVKSTIRSVSKEDSDELLAEVLAMDDADKIKKLINERLSELGIALPAQPVLPA
jgi:phosphotransferase system enzyme I (PtsP)